MASDLNLIVTEERVRDMDLELFYQIDSTSPKATIDFVAHFVGDDHGHYLPKDEAVKLVLSGRKVKDLDEIMAQLVEAIEGMAVPKE